jgi:hypothetical protein
MPTEWIANLLLAVPVPLHNTAQNRDAFASIFVNGGSGESLANERLMFQKAIPLARSGAPTVQVGIGLSVPVKASMRTEIENLITTLNAGQTALNRIYAFAVHSETGLLLQTNHSDSQVRVGTSFTYRDALEALGLVKIRGSL